MHEKLPRTPSKLVTIAYGVLRKGLMVILSPRTNSHGGRVPVVAESRALFADFPLNSAEIKQCTVYIGSRIEFAGSLQCIRKDNLA
jgi:hypothetical protein